MSKQTKRNMLRQFRHDLINSLRSNGFTIHDNNIRVGNEGQFIGIRANYNSQYVTTAGIKPFLALEFFLSDVKIKPDHYYRNPISEIESATEELTRSIEWRDAWDQFINTMVFAKFKPTYEQALDCFHHKTSIALAELRDTFSLEPLEF